MLSAIEIMFFMKELKDLEGSKLDKVYNKGMEIYLQLHKPGKGKIFLKIIPGKVIFVTKLKESVEEPSHFSMSLRKYLGRQIIRKMRQVGFERIIEINFDKHKLIIELFSKGNIVLVDENNIIINCLSNQKWKDRILKVKEEYKLPPERLDVFNMSFNEFKSVIDRSEKGSIVKILASDIGLGGKYAEEVCKRADIKKNMRKVDLKLVYRAINSFKKDDVKPALTKDKNPVFLPTVLDTYKLSDREMFGTMSKAIEAYLNSLVKDDKNIGENKLMRLAKIQEEKIKELEKISVEFKEIGDKIYTEYVLIDGLIKKYHETKGDFKHPKVKVIKKDERKIELEL
jgi:predicted ribosome quality control (RQC) complex YloA/Tae2 family protein